MAILWAENAVQYNQGGIYGKKQFRIAILGTI